MAKDIQKTWDERITRAKKCREDWFDHFRVGLGRDYFEGKQNPGYPQEEWITINKIYAHLMAELPSLYSVDPYFYVRLKNLLIPTLKRLPRWRVRGAYGRRC